MVATFQAELIVSADNPAVLRCKIVNITPLKKAIGSVDVAVEFSDTAQKQIKYQNMKRRLDYVCNYTYDREYFAGIHAVHNNEP